MIIEKYDDILEVIQSRMEEKKIKRYRLANMCMVSYNSVTSWFKKHHEAGTQCIFDMCAALGIVIKANDIPVDVESIKSVVKDSIKKHSYSNHKLAMIAYINYYCLIRWFAGGYTVKMSNILKILNALDITLSME